MLLLIHLASCRFLWPYMALILLWVCHQKYIAVGMSPEAWMSYPCSISPLWKSWIPSWTVILLCEFSVILSNIVTHRAILSNIGLFQPIKARRRSVCPTPSHLPFLPPHHLHDTLAFTFRQ